MPQRIAKQILNVIQESEYIILVPHQHPDGDALGSVTALADYLERIKKEYVIFCATDYPENLSFLEHTEKITSHVSVWRTNKKLTVILMDSGDPVYAGVDNLIKKQKNKPTIVNIDHHATNQQYGDYNLVIESASATTEILYLFFRHNKINITPNMATSLMTGLITDTGNFSNSGTSRHALAIASDLSKKHANVSEIRKQIFQNKSINGLKVWGTVLSRLSINEQHNIAYTFLTQKDIEESGVSEEELEGIANLLNDLNEGNAVLVLKERPEGGVKGSFRTTKDSVDVSLIAKELGGGGHKKAAGFSLEHTLDEAFDYIFATISKKQLAFVKA